MVPETWPPELVTYLRDAWGDPVEVARLSGVGGPGAYRLTTPRGDLIVKYSPRGPEARFYAEVAPRLGRVPVPALHWAGGPWLAIEAIPHALPRSRWVADPAVLGALAALHGAPVALPAGFEPFRPQWTDAMTEAACRVAGLPAELRGRLQSLQAKSQGLFAPACLISGDPNPTNWGMRADGTVVLFDWERFGLGTPALDLAITMPGMGTLDGAMEARVAAAYPEIVAPDDIRRAKIWSIVEFLSNGDALPEGARSMIPKLAKGLPALCEKVDEL